MGYLIPLYSGGFRLPNLMSIPIQRVRPVQELHLVDLKLKLDQWGHPMKSVHVLAFAQHMQHPRKKRYARKYWLQRFVTRNPVLASKVASRIH